MVKRLLGIFLITLLPISGSSIDKSKKAYELIYEDVQLLKQQILQLQEKAQRNMDELKALREQLGDLTSQFKLLQADQAKLQGDLRNLPSQYQVFLDKLAQMNNQLARIIEDLLVLKGGVSAPPTGEPAAAQGKAETPVIPRTKEEVKEAEGKEGGNLQSPAVSPREVYDMAYSDYLKGSYDLAVEGFKLYREQFPASPLADNALYWIGECYFSQRKFDEAITIFNELILNYAQGDKIAAAYLKKGLSLAELKKKEEALAVFKLLISKYPFEEEAKIAQEKIKELSS
jgi:tol-pal system protein YbgF